jgi:hypothetical protein
MSLYRFLQDHFINNQTYLAGTTASTTDAGGSLPSGFIPTVAMEPLDGAAVTAFWTAANIAGLTRGGFGNLGLVRQQWTNIYVAPPITYFVPVPGTANPFRTYRLTGLGVGFPPVLGCS